jgi:hypothetical protein
MRLNVVERLFIISQTLSLFFVFAFEPWTLHSPLLESCFRIFVDADNFIFFIFFCELRSDIPFYKISESKVSGVYIL